MFDADDPEENNILQLAINYLKCEIELEEDHQFDIRENMFKYGMLVNEEERKKVKYDIIQRKHLSKYDEFKDIMERKYDTSEDTLKDDSSDEEIYYCTPDEWIKTINYF